MPTPSCRPRGLGDDSREGALKQSAATQLSEEIKEFGGSFNLFAPCPAP